MHGVFIRGREAMDLLQVVLMLLLMLQWALPLQHPNPISAGLCSGPPSSSSGTSALRSC